MNEETKKELIKQIVHAGKSLIDNAETIAGGYKYQNDFDIFITFDSLTLLPQISVSHGFTPEDSVEQAMD